MALALSICIPTFNRLHYLRVMLNILLPEAEVNGVEVCVSDNHSNDGTAEFLAEISHSYTCLRYVINSENIGLDKNMLSAISMGMGRYIYPLGDDDLLSEGSLHDILVEIKKDCDVLILNGWHTNPTLVKKRLHLPPCILGRSFIRADEAFILLWDKMPFGSFLASRECFIKDYSLRYIGTSHAYTGAVWDALADIEKSKGSCNVKCMVSPTVLLRGGEKSWRKDAALIMLYEIPYWFSLIMEKDAYKQIVPSIRSEYLRSQMKIRSLIHLRAIGQLNISDVRKLGRACSPAQVRKLKIVAMLPRLIAQFIAKTRVLLSAIAKIMLKR
jgi:glycosyltransferase involved in cell wall biosynthesis